MRIAGVLALLSLLSFTIGVVGCRSNHSNPWRVVQTTTSARIDELESVLTPPPGTTRKDVENMYGEPLFVTDTKAAATSAVHVYRVLSGLKLEVFYSDSLVVEAYMDDTGSAFNSFSGPETIAWLERAVALKGIQLEQFRASRSPVPWHGAANKPVEATQPRLDASHDQ